MAQQEKAKSLEEGLEAAQQYEGDPLDCPCIQHMKEGPCGDKFVVAYRCFLDSKEEEKGADCIDSFRAMQQCFMENPEHYKEFLGDGDDEGDEDQQAEAQKKQEALEWQMYNHPPQK